MSDFEQVHEREEFRDEVVPGDLPETLRATPPAPHDEPEARRRIRVERMLHRGRPGVSYPRTFRRF